MNGMNLSRRILLYPLFVILGALWLTGCDRITTPKDVAAEFWRAIQTQDMEKAKNLSTWDSVDYLKYFNSDKLRPERFVLGEQKVGDASAEVIVTLYSARQGQSGVKIPGTTRLIKTEQGWRVNVKTTLSSVVSQTVNNVFDQLGNFMRDSLKELDETLNQSLNELGEALEESANEIKKELSRPIEPPQTKPVQPGAKQI